MVAAPDMDYLTLDYLAEVSLSIMALQQHRDPAAGYARDFVGTVKSLAPFWRDGQKTRIVTNAGGLNPRACAEAVAEVLRAEGCTGMKVGLVTGDDVLPIIADSQDAEKDVFTNWETMHPISTVEDRLVTANAYIGADGPAKALADGADIVVTGRVADPSLAVAACVHHYGWDWHDYDRIAGATIAGHIIECGSQACGGISTHWLELPDLVHMGFPVVEVSEDGSCVVTKPDSMGGRVNVPIVKEQLLYELGDPARYLSPDATVSFLSLNVEEIAPNRVRITGAKGSPPPPTYKVSATYRDGFWAQGTVTLFGRNVIAKGKKAGAIILERLKEAGYTYARSNVECVGANHVVKGALPEPGLLETILRVSVADPNKDAVERFAKELSPLACGGPQGTTGYSGGRPRVTPVFGYWPCLVERERVHLSVDVIEV
jgi:hypothetical protein